MLDRTTEAVSAQIEAMAAKAFEVGIFDAVTERMLLRNWERATVLKSVPWLRYANLNGYNIFIRIAGEHDLSLLDDLKPHAIEQMKEKGFSPALLIETSPRNFQAWLRHDRVLNKGLSTFVAKALAQEFHADQGSADWRHFGRLAGFTNRKELHREANGRFPYVRLIEASGMVYERASEFIPAMAKEHARQAEEGKIHRLFFQAVRSLRPHGQLKSIDNFRNDPRYGGAQSRSDMAYAIYALDHGIDASTVQNAIASQDLSFKGSLVRQSQYIERIIRKARRLLDDRGRQR
jgi:hypothetical protein